MKIIVADDCESDLDILTNALKDLGHMVMAVSSGKQALEMFNVDRPDLVILDVVMDGMNGFECAKHICIAEGNDWIPIIFLSADVTEKSIAEGIDAGGDDYLAKPLSLIMLAAKIRSIQRISNMRKQLIELTHKLSIVSTTDTLTGLYNRLHFNEVIQDKLAEAERFQERFAMLLMDLNKFKQINDSIGHQAGDFLLQNVAKRLISCLRANDCVARLCGDEFAVLLSCITDDSAVQKVGEKIIQIVTQPYLLYGQLVTIEVSVGMAIYPDHATTAETVVMNADAAMHRVKLMSPNSCLFYSKDFS